MKKMRAILGLAALASSLTLGGCVSTGTYKKLQDENKNLKASVDQSQSKAAELEKQMSGLAQEKEALEKASAAATSEYTGLVDQLQQEVQQGQLKIRQYKNMMSVDVAEKIFFDSGVARLKDTGKDVLLKVAQALAPLQDKVIRVVGHTDNVPVLRSRNAFPTNWELSVIRASNVVRFLQEDGKIAPERLVASGRAEFDPISPNDTAEGRQQNRRIEILLIDKAVLDAMEGRVAREPEAQ